MWLAVFSGSSTFVELRINNILKTDEEKNQFNLILFITDYKIFR